MAYCQFLQGVLHQFQHIYVLAYLVVILYLLLNLKVIKKMEKPKNIFYMSIS